MAQLAQLGVAGGLSDIVGSDKDTEEGDSEEDMEEDGEGDQRIMAMASFFSTMLYKPERSVEWTHACLHTFMLLAHTFSPYSWGVIFTLQQS